MVYPSSAPSDRAPVPPDAQAILEACRVRYLKEIGQLLHEGDYLPADKILTFQTGVSAYFQKMVAPTQKSGFDGSDGLTASRISLVGDNDLELEIRLGEFSARLQEKAGAELWRLYLRFITLLNRPELSTADNPIGPRGIALGLNDLCSGIGENHEKTLQRIERLENYFADNLIVLYASLNDFLEKRGVEAAHPNLITAPESVKTSQAASGLSAAATLQRQLLGAGPAMPMEAGRTEHGTAAASLFTQAMLDRLLARMDELERLGHFRTPLAVSAGTGASLENLIPGLFTAESGPLTSIPHAVRSDELGLPAGAPEAATIDALALIFEAIFASESLPQAVKTALASLQIPLLKAAMLDSTFFTAESHPARKLLDRMARAALGLPLDAPSEHPVCAELQHIASQVRHEFSRDTKVFESPLSRIDRLIARRDQSAAHLATLYRPLLAEGERQKQAAAQHKSVLDQLITQSVPDNMARFLRQQWARLLGQVWLQGGEESSQWKAYFNVAKQLLWSIQPKTEIEDRKHLARVLPDMLKLLNAGMEEINMPETERTAFLDTCFALQTAALRGSGQPAEIIPEAPPAEDPLAHYTEIRSGDLRLKLSLAESGTIHVAPLTPGAWMAFEFAGRVFCGRLAENPEDCATSLLCNPDRDFAIALPTAELRQQLQDKRASIASSSSLFNSAAEKALHDAPKNDVLT